MDCDKATALVEKLADGEASPLEKRDAEAHVESCASCRDYLAFLTAVSRNARESKLEAPPESYWEHLPRKILKRIESDRAGRQRGFFPKLFSPVAFRVAAIAATFVVVVAVGVNVLRDDSLTVTEPARPESGEPPEQAAPALDVSESPEILEAPRAEPAERATSPAGRPQAKVESGALEDAPAPIEKRASSEEADSLRALGYTAGADERPREAAPPAAPAPPAASVSALPPAEGLQSNFAEVAGEPGDARSRRQLSREKASGSPASANEPAPSGGRAELAIAGDECEALRKVLATTGEEGTRAADVRYELARCSLEKLEALERPEGEEGDEIRATAIADAEAFLSLEDEGPRAEEIHEALSRVKKPR